MKKKIQGWGVGVDIGGYEMGCKNCLQIFGLSGKIGFAFVLNERSKWDWQEEQQCVEMHWTLSQNVFPFERRVQTQAARM